MASRPGTSPLFSLWLSGMNSMADARGAWLAEAQRQQQAMFAEASHQMLAFLGSRPPQPTARPDRLEQGAAPPPAPVPADLPRPRATGTPKAKAKPASRPSVRGTQARPWQARPWQAHPLQAGPEGIRSGLIPASREHRVPATGACPV